ncbi:MAG: BCD family MFS transporter [Anaerolineales bacterium]|nr:BCD family MFS transporter [Anaerolineales bacterium]
MFLKRLQLGLIHAAVAITLVPINSTLNRILIEDQGLAATLVVLLFSPPYLFSFVQVAVGSFSDRYPLFGLRRTPYIVAGLMLCVAGLMLAAQVALILPENFWLGLGLGVVTFGAWGMGFNLATVSYFSLASEISGEQGRSKTTATMFFMMIVFIIGTAATLSRMLENYTPDLLQGAFMTVALIAWGMGVLGLLGLEKRDGRIANPVYEERYSLKTVIREIRSNRQVALFFVYLMLMLAAVLGQDVLLEPFAARAFELPVSATTRITSIWGTCYLLSLVVAGMLEGRVSKLTVARMASWLGAAAFGVVAISAFAGGKNLFYFGVVLLGLATGPATVSNLSLMLDMTVPGKVGLFIGAWGSASAFARLLGAVITAIFRDLARLAPNSAVMGYAAGFVLLGVFLVVSLIILRQIDVKAFQKGGGERPTSVIERAALAGEI